MSGRNKHDEQRLSCRQTSSSCNRNSPPKRQTQTSLFLPKHSSASSLDGSQAHAGVKTTPFLTKGVDSGGKTIVLTGFGIAAEESKAAQTKVEGVAVEKDELSPQFWRLDEPYEL